MFSSAAKAAQIRNLKSIFDPYFTLGLFFGLTWKKKNRLSHCYVLFTFLFICFCVGRGISFQKLEKFSGALVFRFLLLLYAVHCLVAFYLVIKIQVFEELENFLREWSHLREPEGPQPPRFDLLLKIRSGGIIFIIGTSIVNGLFVGLGSLGLVIKFPWMKSYLVYEGISFFNGFIVFFTSFPFCMAQVFYSLVCIICLFENTDFFTHLTNMDMISLIRQLPKTRRYYHKMVRLTDVADTMCSKYAFAIYGLNIPTLIITAFLLVRETSMPAASRFTFSVWLGVLFLQIGVVSIIPAALHFATHRPITYLECAANNITKQKFTHSSRVFHQLSLFLYQLTVRNIGITGAGFFVITKRLILTIMSVMLTYFAVILKLDLSSKDKCQCFCVAQNETIGHG